MHFSSVISSALRYLQDVMLLGDAKRIQKKHLVGYKFARMDILCGVYLWQVVYTKQIQENAR